MVEDSLLRNTYLGLKYDWVQKLMRQLGLEFGDWRRLSQEIEAFQAAEGLDVTGLMTAQTRLNWIARYPDFGLHLLGEHLSPGRCLLTESGEYVDVLERIGTWGKARCAFLPEMPYSAYIWAIRGVIRDGNGHWVQTDSAWRFMQSSYGHRDHFSSAKADYADTCFVLIWHDLSGKAYFQTFEGTANPGSIWPNGTAHLCTGQYFYKLGRHRTRERDHIRAVLESAHKWPEHWVTDKTEDSVQYFALESTSPIEVVRSTGQSLDISEDDILRAEIGIAHREPTYVDPYRIKINIHTCATEHASSLGCMNILPEQYAECMRTLESLSVSQREKYGFMLDIPFYLCDASALS